MMIKKNLNLDINIDDIINELKELMKNLDANINSFTRDNLFIFECRYRAKIRDFESLITITFACSADRINYVELECFDKNVNDYDLTNYYYENIQEKLFVNLNRNNNKRYCVRIYKTIFNKSTIRGEYLVNYNCKIKFFSIFDFEKENSYAEHMIAFDVDISAPNLDVARSKAYNLISDFSAFLSVLIDTGFENIQSKYMHFFFKQDNQGITLMRQPTGIFDDELQLVVRDNFVGLRPMSDPYLLYGNIYLYGMESNYQMSSNLGKDDFLEEAFKHRKLDVSKSNKTTYRESIKYESHSPFEELIIPRILRKYFSSITEIEKINVNQFNAFRNCCRLYNLSHNVERTNITAAIVYRINAIEALAKGEKMSFSEFVRTYKKKNLNEQLLDYLYGNVRSGHVHSGEFSFGEYSVNYNENFSVKMSDRLTLYKESKDLTREVILLWINEKLVKDYNFV